ncbi:FAD-binding and (Fe-S)-binding domain-containing protein [Pseudidiomarina sp. E22-M8]|uniref:FAD-binding and (Fe-S)-binding domain-containing protein n=1 Tax=Pseudidiomarina sp. E22-M8 TaxID=3424768 RepID=UPI00403C8ACD
MRESSARENSVLNPAFLQGVSELLPTERRFTDLTRRLAHSTDASFYHKVPELVVEIASADEMRELLKLAQQYQVPLTFRAAGTSLSGQAISDSVLVLLTRDWQAIAILEQGTRVRLQPGVIGADANRKLLPYGRKIGPDPASINTCKIGGIAANNASGMCCGVRHNSYHTLQELTFILADGTLVDTSDATSVAAFRQSHAQLLDELATLGEQVRGDAELSAKIAHQYRLKNTMGYGLNALLDYQDPVALLSHLLIGSEGTLGFIAEITYQTVAVPKASATGLYLFADSHAACAVISELKTIGVDAVEFMDGRSLASVRELLLAYTSTTPAPAAVALLIEIGRDSGEQLTDGIAAIEGCLGALNDVQPLCPFSEDPVTAAALWQIRKGLFPAVGAVRASGTTVIIEDVAFPLDQLPDAVTALQQLFVEHGYHEAIIFGHALDGNVHFVFTQGFATTAETERYANFMAAVVTLVTERFAGTLKAEHGTGRNMAPYLYAQWGGAGLAVMQKLKQLIDPVGILNPGVIINDNPNAHIEDLKQLPAVDATVDACIECGFCEPQCPSLHYTLSPRQRIALMRRTQHQTPADQQQIQQDFQHLGIDSCAATGLCATACPVGINTGSWVQQLRAQQARHTGVANWTAKHLSSSLQIARFGMSAARNVAKIVPKLVNTLVPAGMPDLPPAATTTMTEQPQPAARKMVYFITCPNRMFGYAQDNQRSLPDTVVRLCNKAGIEVILPESAAQSCCGQPWQSKGYPQQAAERREQLRQLLWQASEQGRWPIVLDASPCALQLDDCEHITTLELSAFLYQHVVPELALEPINEPLLVHVTCSSRHLDQGTALRNLAQLCSTKVVEPDGIQCCGFAGDKGFTLPELNSTALAPLAEQVPKDCSKGVSTSRTCEIGLTQHSGVAYAHIAFLLDAISHSNVSNSNVNDEGVSA